MRKTRSVHDIFVSLLLQQIEQLESPRLHSTTTIHIHCTISVQSVHLKENDLIKNDEYILYSTVPGNKSVKTQISFNTVYSTVLY